MCCFPHYVCFCRTGNSLVECGLHPHLGGVVTRGMVAEAVKGATAGDIALTSFSLVCCAVDLLTYEIYETR
jgi:hypothetical protein